MSAEAITGVVGITSAAVGALGLLLAWYRHDSKTARPSRPGRSPGIRRIVTRARVAALCALVIVVAAVVGVWLMLGSSPPRPGAVQPLTEVQYTSQLSQMCLQSDEEARRIEDADPQGGLLGAAVDVEKRLVDHIEQLVPPQSDRAAHDELVATWRQRIALLQSVYRRLDPADETVEDDLRRADQLSGRITEISTSLGVPECGFA